MHWGATYFGQLSTNPHRKYEEQTTGMISNIALTGTKFDLLISKLQTFGKLLNLSSGRFVLSRYIVGAILKNISGRTREVVNFRLLVRA